MVSLCTERILIGSEKRNHEKFLNNLKESHGAVWYIAWWLWTTHNYEISIQSRSTAKSHSNWKNHVDNGDLIISSQDGRLDRAVVEVKQERKNFTCRNDFQYGSMLVAPVWQFDKLQAKPYAYVRPNETLTYAGIINVELTRKYWSKVKIDNPKYENYVRDIYSVPKQHVKFVKIDVDSHWE